MKPLRNPDTRSYGATIFSVILYVIIHTMPLWEGGMGYGAVPIYFVTLFCLIIVAFLFLYQIILLFEKENRTRKRIIITIILGFVVISTLLLPEGIAYYLSKKEEPLLRASIGGTANCRTTFELRKNNKFHEKTTCFSITEVTGNYTFRNDTFFFEKITLGRDVKEFYKFAVFKPNSVTNDYNLVRYKDENDSIGNKLWITTNNLPGYEYLTNK